MKKTCCCFYFIKNSGIRTEDIGSQLKNDIDKLPKVTGAGIGNQQFSHETAKLLDKSAEEAKALNDEYVSTEHILLALSQSESTVGELLRTQGVKKETILNALKDIRGNQRSN